MNIIELAKQAGFADSKGVVHAAYQLEAFAALVEAAARADEREECAKLFETITKDPAVPPVHLSLSDTAKAIRARGTT